MKQKSNIGDCFEKITNNATGAVYYRSGNISAPHGFSTRAGGVSVIPHLASMNMGSNLGDDPEKVAENYRRFALAVGFDSAKLVLTKQIHSNIVRTVTEEDAGKTFECDGLATAVPGIAVSIKTADCVPILLCDGKAKVCCAVHAGWRGTAAGICSKAVEAMTSLGADPCNIQAAIGAAIQKCCYEVGEDMRSEVGRLSGSEMRDKYIKYERGGLYADIVGMNIEMLMLSGVPAGNISSLGECTCCRPDVFFSHRASGGKRGVMCAVIANNKL